jgi:(p)ppGpp synthase/HD superfamily hydrolase
MLTCATEVMVAAAWLHDVLEDCLYYAKRLPHEFGAPVVHLVKQLTNPSKGSDLPRAMRKDMDRAHLRAACREVRIIKFLDRIDNVRDMSGAKSDFKRLYHTESIVLGNALIGAGDDELLNALHLELCRELPSLL